jgi:hypothetical protein
MRGTGENFGRCFFVAKKRGTKYIRECVSSKMRNRKKCKKFIRQGKMSVPQNLRIKKKKSI